MKLISIELEHFKGIEHKKIRFDGKDTSILGQNETGKTTVFDAYTWCLTGKDSLNRANSTIKPQKENGEEIHNIETQVEMEIEIDGDRHQLRRVFKENWTRKRGAAKQTFSGHTTDYYVDGVPAKAGEYNDIVEELIGDDPALISDPRHFSENLHWKDRREIILGIENVSDEEIAKKNPELKPIVENQHTPEQQMKIAVEKKKKINDKLKSIPERIDENTHNMPETPTETEEKLQKELKNTEEIINKKNKEAKNINHNFSKEYNEIKMEKNKAQNEHLKKYNKEHAKSKEEKKDMENDRNTIENDIIHLKEKKQDTLDSIHNGERILKTDKAAIKKNKRLIEKNNEDIKQLEEQIKKTENNKVVCPTCKQKLPAEEGIKIAYKETSRLHINIKSIKRSSDSLQTNIDNNKSNVKANEKEIKNLRAKANKTKSHLDKIKTVKENLEKEINNFEYPVKPKAFNTSRYEKRLEKCRIDKEEKISKLAKEIKEHRGKQQKILEHLRTWDEIHRLEKRNTELATREKKYAEAYEEAQEQIYLLEKYTVEKVNMLEEKVNRHFKLTKFKMFDVQINGGIVETCEATYKGIAYQDLNNGAKINTGMDIINTLTEDKEPIPVWIDNAEAVNELLDIEPQTIKLYVNNSPKLKIKQGEENE